MADKIARAWDAEYAAGRYTREAPVAFVTDIVAAARAAGADHGLYIGCGNGRNYVPLTAAGLDLTGLDISPTAIGGWRAATRRSRGRACGARRCRVAACWMSCPKVTSSGIPRAGCTKRSPGGC